MRGYGGTFSFRVRGGQEAAFQMLAGVRIFTLAESLGGVESLIEHPVSMTHASVPAEVRERMGLSPNLIRISVGLEDLDDLIDDLSAALERV
jgi:cystathionine beta-lyase/cystathionine gamma-synthase